MWRTPGLVGHRLAVCSSFALLILVLGKTGVPRDGALPSASAGPARCLPNTGWRAARSPPRGPGSRAGGPWPGSASLFCIMVFLFAAQRGDWADFAPPAPGRFQAPWISWPRSPLELMAEPVSNNVAPSSTASKLCFSSMAMTRSLRFQFLEEPRFSTPAPFSTPTTVPKGSSLSTFLSTTPIALRLWSQPPHRVRGGISRAFAVGFLSDVRPRASAPALAGHVPIFFQALVPAFKIESKRREPFLQLAESRKSVRKTCGSAPSPPRPMTLGNVWRCCGLSGLEEGAAGTEPWEAGTLQNVPGRAQDGDSRHQERSGPKCQQ